MKFVGYRQVVMNVLGRVLIRLDTGILHKILFCRLRKLSGFYNEMCHLVLGFYILGSSLILCTHHTFLDLVPIRCS